jgi:RHS repeat-associated protein
MVIMLFNSNTGRWEVGGAATVTSDGQSVQTKPGQGIYHFSQAYATIPGPIVRAAGALDKTGVDSANGSSSTQIVLPSFKTFGTSITPSLTYRSSWAKPNATINAMFDFPDRKIDLVPAQNGAKGITFRAVVKECDLFSCWDEEKSFYTTMVYHSEFSNVTSKIQPKKIDAFFEAGPVKSQTYSFDSTGDNPIPARSVFTFGVDLRDPTTNKFIPSGSYPYRSHFDIKFDAITMGTAVTSYWTPSFGSGVSTESFEDKATDQIFSQDLTGNIPVQNYSNSAAGKGWRINGAERILNPNGNNIFIEDTAGNIQTYAANDTIETALDVNSFGGDLTKGVGLNSWPDVVFPNKNNSNNLLKATFQSNATAVSMGTLPNYTGIIYNYVDNWSLSWLNNTITGKVDWYHYWTCYAEYRPFSSAKAIPSQALVADSTIYATDSAQHSLFQTSSSLPLLGAQAIPPTLTHLNYPGYYGVGFGDADLYCNQNGLNCTIPPGLWKYWQVYEIHDTILNPMPDRCPTYFTPDGISYGSVPVKGDSVVNGKQALNSPLGITSSPEANTIVIADTGNHKVRKYNTQTGQTLTIAGDGNAQDLQADGIATHASLYHPRGVTYDAAGNLYISTETGYIRKVDTYGNISVFAGNPAATLANETDAFNTKLLRPYGLVYDNAKDYLYIADTGNHRVVRLNTKTGIATTVAGSSVAGFSGDNGPAISASLSSPTHLGLDNEGNLIIADSGNNRIRRVVFDKSAQGTLTYVPILKDNSVLTRNQDLTWTKKLRDRTTVNYDQTGNVTSVKDPAGNLATYSYEAKNRISEITFPTGQKLSYIYSGEFLSQIIDPANRITNFDYGSDGTLNQVTFPDGTRRSYVYDQNGLLTKEVDQRSSVSTYVYNQFSRIKSIIDANNSMVTINDEASTNLANFESGKASSLQSSGLGNNQLKSSISDPRNQTTEIAKDFQGFISKIKNAKGQEFIFNRDTEGNPISITYPDLSKTTFTYDPTTRDQLSTTDVNTGITESQTFDSFGNVTSKTNGRGQVFRSTYNPTNGLLTSEVAPGGQRVDYNYNSKGQITGKTVYPASGQSLTTSYEYDISGNISKVISSDGKETQFVYDLAGNQTQAISFTNGLATATTQYFYDAFNRLTKVISPNAEVTAYTYLPTGELSTITDPKGKVRTFEYDKLGRLFKKTDSLGQIYQLSYDDSGNLIQEIDPNGNIKKYSYDELNQMVQAQFPDDLIGYQYDVKGKVIQASNSVSNITWIRDSKSRIVFERTTGLGTISDYPIVELSSVYDGAGNRTELAAGNTTISYNYDISNRLTSIANSNGNSFNFGYDSANRLTALLRPGSRTDYSYKPSGVVDSIIHSSGGVTRAYAQYDYDLRNYPTQKRSVAGTSSYSYDSNGQLTGVTAPSGNETFGYDPLGNRLSDQLGSYTYDPSSQRLTEDWQYNYSYDNNGNMIARIPKDTAKPAVTYSYNSRNQLVRIQTTVSALGPVVKDISYTYDVLGRRMEKKITDLADSSKSYARRFVYDGDNILFEYNGSSNMLASYTHSPLAPDDVLSATVTQAGVTAGLSTAQGHYYFLKDALGSITDIMNPSGSVVQKYDYSSFGKLLSIKDGAGVDISANPVLKTAFTFTGREWDEESGLYYYRARYYNPEIGRFLQVDPDPGRLSGPNSHLNKYTYVNNFPTALIDPSGRSILSTFTFDLENFGKGLIGNIGSGFDRFVKSPGFQSPEFQFMVIIIAAIYIGPAAMAAVGNGMVVGGTISGVASWYRGNKSWESFSNGVKSYLSDPEGLRNSAIAALVVYDIKIEYATAGMDMDNLKLYSAIFSAKFIQLQLPLEDMTNDEENLWTVIGALIPSL